MKGGACIVNNRAEHGLGFLFFSGGPGSLGSAERKGSAQCNVPWFPSALDTTLAY